MTRPLLKGWRWYASSLAAGVATGAIAAIMYTHLPPLSTHRLAVAPNSDAVKPPVALQGYSDLPKLLVGQDDPPHWAIIGGTLLQTGLSRLSIPALERAIAHDQHNKVLHVALGEALALANDGRITERAKTAFEFVLKADPNDLVARYYMAHWLLQNGKPKPALVKWVGLMRTVGADQVWNDRLWTAMPAAAEQVGVSRLTLEALCASM